MNSKYNKAMKYMTFNRSCSYACIANLLESYGIQANDREIVIQASIPYCFDCDGNQYKAGPMLQSKNWYDLYLKPKGLEFIEQEIKQSMLKKFLHSFTDAIIGLKIEKGGGKHAVIYKGRHEDKYKFLNVRYINDDQPDFYLFSESEIVSLTDKTIKIGTVSMLSTKTSPDTSIASKSYENFCSYQNEIISFFAKNALKEDLEFEKERLFAPLLLDILSMTQIIEEMSLSERILQLREQYMETLKSNNIKGTSSIDKTLLKQCLAEISQMILQKNPYI